MSCVYPLCVAQEVLLSNSVPLSHWRGSVRAPLKGPQVFVVTYRPKSGEFDLCLGGMGIYENRIYGLLAWWMMYVPGLWELKKYLTDRISPSSGNSTKEASNKILKSPQAWKGVDCSWKFVLQARHLGRVGVGVFKFRTGERKEGVDKVKREQFSLQYAINLFTSVHTDRQKNKNSTCSIISCRSDMKDSAEPDLNCSVIDELLS